MLRALPFLPYQLVTSNRKSCPAAVRINTLAGSMHTHSKLTPEAIPDGFEWKGDKIHLTYSGFHQPQDILARIRRATSTPIVGWSVTGEDTSEDTPDGVVIGYEHTHAAILFGARLGLRGSRIFDLWIDSNDGTGLPVAVHPNAQLKMTAVSFELLFTQYHAGRKYDITTGKVIFKEPVFREFHLPPLFDFHRVVMNEMVAAPTLFEACVAGEIRPRTVSDLKALRDDSVSNARKKFKHLYDSASFHKLGPAQWSVLHIFGASGLGKTKWAVAQFKNPCMIKPFDSVGCLETLSRVFDPAVHDGLVLDEADLKFMSRTQVIAFFDQDEDASLDVRYKSFTLPAGLRKIVVSNPSPHGLYPADPFGAIARRFQSFEIVAPTWKQLPGQQADATMQQIVLTPPTAPIDWRP